MSTLADTLRAWLDEFLGWMEQQRYSPRSVQCYRKDLRQLVDWVGRQPQLGQPGELGSEQLERYTLHLMTRRSQSAHRGAARNLSAVTRNRHLAEIKSFFGWLKRKGLLLGNPAAELLAVREPQRLPRNVLSVAEVGRLLMVVPTNSPQGLRDRAVLELLYGTGIRRGELFRLTLEDLRLSEGFVHVLGKGDKERVLPLGRACQRALIAYLERGRPLLLSERTRALWISAFHGGPLSDQEMMRVLKGYGKAAGLARPLAFHLFRHTCATHLLQGGADLRSIQTLLGHANVNTTMVYTRVEVSQLRQCLQRFHPREQEEL